jgi:transposase
MSASARKRRTGAEPEALRFGRTPVIHAAGDKVLVDYSGKKLGIVNPATGEIREAEIFVALLGASGYNTPRAPAEA